jgi:hypothetical protein
MPASQHQYEDRIIAFIDILGFRSLINETVKEGEILQEKLDALVEALNLIKDEFKKAQDDSELSNSVMITYFSDSIVISVRQHNSVDLLTIFETLKKIQIRLVERKILLRGGIVIGKLIHKENIILGPAMIEAYDLENKSALYPRITIDPDVMEMSAKGEDFEEGVIAIKDFNYQKTFEIDFDNTYYIDYFSGIKEYLPDGDEIKYYKHLRAIIRSGVKRKDIGIRMKHMWMLRKFNLYKPSHIRDMAYKELDDINEQIRR